ncbi:MAG: hypothetical protein LBI56_04080 [Puniceicoccales bacterium]|jgi:phage-related tail fiber protein|nr:hypothetical protein [Puniceicoccales bacterium]
MSVRKLAGAINRSVSNKSTGSKITSGTSSGLSSLSNCKSSTSGKILSNRKAEFDPTHILSNLTDAAYALTKGDRSLRGRKKLFDMLVGIITAINNTSGKKILDSAEVLEGSTNLSSEAHNEMSNYFKIAAMTILDSNLGKMLHKSKKDVPEFVTASQSEEKLLQNLIDISRRLFMEAMEEKLKAAAAIKGEDLYNDLMAEAKQLSNIIEYMEKN